MEENKIRRKRGEGGREEEERGMRKGARREKGRRREMGKGREKGEGREKGGREEVRRREGGK